VKNKKKLITSKSNVEGQTKKNQFWKRTKKPDSSQHDKFTARSKNQDNSV
jgi:hypothetical protein